MWFAVIFYLIVLLTCFREELCSFQREIEVLSEQYSQKCLENAHLAQALEAERQALRQCQRENQELNAHNQVRTRSSTTPLACKHRFRSVLNGSFLAPSGAEQPTGSRDHQDALHGSWGWAWRRKHHNTGKRALRVRSKRQTARHPPESSANGTKSN